MLGGILALLAGVLFGFGLAPFDWWILSFLSIAIFFTLLLLAPAQAGRTAFLYGLGKYGFGAS